jgi:hypothetical protein
MLTLLLLSSLAVQPTKPAPPAPTSPPAGGPAPVVYLPPEAAALIVRIAAASKSGQLCQSELTEARARALTLDKRETELLNEQADVLKERDTAADAMKRVAVNSAAYVAARNQTDAARSKWQNLQALIGNTRQEQQRVKTEITNKLACIQTSQSVLKGLFSAGSSVTK